MLELLRRRRLSEPYAILWLLASVVLLVLSIWDDLLDSLAELVGIATPPTRCSWSASASSWCCCWSFSTVVSRLTRENKVLAQEVARLNRERDGDAQTTPEQAPERQETPITE